jgi:HEAT repeat protein
LRHRPDLVRAGLRDPDASVRSAAGAALGGFGDDSAADALAEMLKDDDAGARQGAVAGLARIGTPKALAYLAQAMESSDTQVQVAAMNAILQRSKIQFVTPLDPNDRETWKHQVEVVKKFPSVRRALQGHAGQ